MLYRLLFTLFLVFTALPAQAAEVSCDNPQDAARSLLDWLQPEKWDPEAASQCLEFPESMADRKSEVAVKFKKVLDARGWYVPTDDLPTDPDFTDDEGKHRLVPIATVPELVLAKRGGHWVYAVEIVGQTDALYDATFSGLTGFVQGLVPTSVQGKLFGLDTWQYLYFLLLVLASLLAGLLSQKLVADQVLRVSRRLKVQLSEKVIRGTRMPLTWFATGIVFRLGISDLQLAVRSTQWLMFFANTIISFAVVLMASRLINVISEVFAKRAEATESKMDDQVIPLLSRAAKGVVWILGIVFVVQNWGVDVASLLAGLGIGGLAFALAAKDTLENLLGSLTIFTDRPFQIGDWVIIGGGTEGVVEEVGFRTTRVRTFYNSIVAVPNGKVANSPIDNMGQRRWRRVTATLGLTYNTSRADLDAYVDGIRKVIQDHPGFAPAPATCEIHFKAFGDSALEIMVYFFLDVPDWSAELKAKHEIFSGFIRVAEDLGVSFAFPSTTMYVESVPSEFRVASGK